MQKDPNGRFAPTKLGLVLVGGYDAMGRANLTQPAIRKQQEEDCKAISLQTRAKDQVRVRVLRERQWRLGEGNQIQYDLTEVRILWLRSWTSRKTR